MYTQPIQYLENYTTLHIVHLRVHVHVHAHVHLHVHVHVYLHVLVHVHAIRTVHFDYLCCT